MLSPVVLIGDKGLTEEVVKEIDRSLKAHELIKVRAMTGDRKARAQWMTAICEQLGAEPVQEIGKMLVIYRKNPEEKPGARHEARGKPSTGKPRSKPLVPRASSPKSSTKDTSHPRSRTPSPRPESEPRRRRPRTSR